MISITRRIFLESFSRFGGLSIFADPKNETWKTRFIFCLFPASKSALTSEPFNIFGPIKAPRDQYHQTHLSGKFQPIWRTFDFRGSQKMKRGKHVSFFEIPASKSALTFERFNIFGRTKAPRDQYHQAHLSGKLQPIWRTSKKNSIFLKKKMS